jgi:aminomethyltransferase
MPTRQSPLQECHEKLGARFIEFAGWSMPLQYSSILEEHQAVRENAGLFDISHMGEFWVEGDKAVDYINSLLTNDVSKLQVGEGQYSLMLNEKGGVIDDLILYRTKEKGYLFIVNAAKIDEDFNWMQSHMKVSASLDNDSDRCAGIALQGPRALEITAKIFNLNLDDLPSHNKIKTVPFLDSKVYVARTGYTGEDGLEFFCYAEFGERLWEKVLEVGKEFGIKPCGLGARDTLRLEACLPLNGNDLSPEITPLEAGLKTFVSFEKPHHFPGRDVLEKQIRDSLKRRSVAFVMEDEKSPPPRAHYKIFVDDQEIGEVTSGTLSPTLKQGIGMGLVSAEFAKAEQKILIEIRGQKYRANIHKKPLYKRKTS